jgi:hypothetical protein
MQLVIPITMIKGGINPDKPVIRKPNKAIEPIDQTTPIATINKQNITTLRDLKNKYKIIAARIAAKMVNNFISLFRRTVIPVRIYGKPENLTLISYFS